jgi:hypothetical protein
MLKMFPKPPMVAYKQPPNLKSMLCRAKLPQNKHPKGNWWVCNHVTNLAMSAPTHSKQNPSPQTKPNLQITWPFHLRN